MIPYTQFPQAVEIQTTAACNASCIICPYTIVHQGIPKGSMQQGLFEKIITEIGQKPVRVIPYLNSEPLLDPKFPERLHFISDKCARAEIEVSTNLSRLDDNMRARLRGSRFTELRLSVFGFTRESYERIMGLQWDLVKRNLDALVRDTQFRSRISRIGLVMVDFPSLPENDKVEAERYCKDNCIEFHLWGFLDRARNVSRFSNNISHAVVRGCEQQRPLERLHVAVDGKVILCCQDWAHKYVLGDLTQQTISDVWNSPAYQDARHKIYCSGIDAPDLCKKCKLAVI